MTGHRKLRLASLLASAGMLTLAATGVAAQQNQGSQYGGQASPPWTQAPSYQQGQPYQQGQRYGSQPMWGPDRQQQQLNLTPRQAFGIGYWHGQMDVASEARQRVQQLADELFELGYTEGLQAGLQSNPQLDSRTIERYGQGQFAEGYRQGRSDTMANAQGGPGAAMPMMPMQGDMQQMQSRMPQMQEHMRGMQMQGRMPMRGPGTGASGQMQGFQDWQGDEQARRMDQAYSEWRAAQPPAASVEPGYQQGRAATGTQSLQQQIDDASRQAIGEAGPPPVRSDTDAATGGSGEQAMSAGRAGRQADTSIEQTASRPEIPVEPSNASRLVGWTVESSDDQEIGQIDAVILSPDGDQIETLVVQRSDGFLMGVPVEQVRSVDQQTVALAMTAQEVRDRGGQGYQFDPSMNVVRGQD